MPKQSTRTVKDTVRPNEDEIYESIYNAVMEHRLPPGTKLTEATFSEYFGVSRTIIRKALTQLSRRNVVEIRPIRGAIVASPSVEETHEVFEARRVIEQHIIKTVIENLTKSRLKQLEDIAKEEQKSRDNNDIRTLVRLSNDFHLLLAEMADNNVLTTFLSELISRTSLIIALYKEPGIATCTSHDHWELINLIEKKNVAAATNAMVEHLNEIEGNLNLKKIKIRSTWHMSSKPFK